MKEQPEADRASVHIFPPVVPLAIVLIGVGIDWLWPSPMFFEIPTPARYWVGGSIVACAILGLGFWSVVLVRRSGQSENPWKPTVSIIDRGPFNVTRNPMYLQMVLVCVGLAVLLSNLWILALAPACAWILQRFAIVPEEAYLEQKFGEQYTSYKSRVRRWL